MTDFGDGSRPLLFELLGPLRVRRYGQDLNLGPRQQRLILALLLTRAGEPVSTPEVITMLWGNQPPASAKNIVHRYVGNLRHLLEPGIAPRAQGCWITSDAAGYRVVADESNLDLLAFRKLAEEARAAADTGNPDTALAAYTKALEMWRGPCAGASDMLVDQLAPFNAVDYECAAAAVEAADLSLRLDSGRSMLNMLRRMATHHFFDEALQARFILVLSAAGQQAEAIARYHSLRRRLLDELGVDPGAEVQAAYREILKRSNVRREDNVVTRFEYPDPKIVRLVSMIRRSDGAIVAVVTSVTGLAATTERWLVDDAAVWTEFPRDLAIVDLAKRPEDNQA
ncbi:BTAD domain-containing putative transcriptional regulator [Micromonospora profundi]|uniref:AfsR/SARP family transcriptional regulator n=1 Tax=Micromonospora profundi TaxID=1420889 RepID=UPI0036504792